MSKQTANLSEVRIPDLTGQELKPGYGIPSQPPTTQEIAETARLHAIIVESKRFDWVAPVLFTVVLIVCLCLIVKNAKRLYGIAMIPVKAISVYLLFLTIRGARKVSGVSASLWDEAKAADKKVTEADRTNPE